MRKKEETLIKNMIIVVMCVGEAKGFTNTGGVVSPSYVKSKPQCKLTVKNKKKLHV